MYVKWLEHSRIEYLRNQAVESGLSAHASATSEIGSTLGHVSVRFKKPVTYPDTVHIRTRIKALGNSSSFILEHEIESAKLGTVAATGESSIVFLNLKTGKAAPVPTPIAAQIRAKL